MAGIEPASERFGPRKSTSVAGRGVSSQASRPARTSCDQPHQARKPSFAQVAASCAAFHLCHARSVTGWKTGTADAASLLEADCYAIALGGEGHSSIGSAVGTCFFALILRARRLSARIPGPASSVEASHPQIRISIIA